jgi:hypothetical protein
MIPLHDFCIGVSGGCSLFSCISPEFISRHHRRHHLSPSVFGQDISLAFGVRLFLDKLASLVCTIVRNLHEQKMLRHASEKIKSILFTTQ